MSSALAGDFSPELWLDLSPPRFMQLFPSIALAIVWPLFHCPVPSVYCALGITALWPPWWPGPTLISATPLFQGSQSPQLLALFPGEDCHFHVKTFLSISQARRWPHWHLLGSLACWEVQEGGQRLQCTPVSAWGGGKPLNGGQAWKCPCPLPPHPVHPTVLWSSNRAGPQ